MKTRPVLASLVPYTPGVLVPGKLKLASNENPLGPSPRAMVAYATAAPQLSLYPDGGTSALREALGQHWAMDPASFLLGNGSDEVLVLIATALLNPGDHILVGAHTFSEYRFAGLLMDATVEAVPMADFRFHTADFLERCTLATRAVFLCSPNNPTGTLIPPDELVDFLNRVPQDVLVVLDAAYSEYADPPSAGSSAYPGEKDLLTRFPNLLILHTFSKIYGLAGLRVGYAMGQPGLIADIAKVRQPFNVNLPAQAAAVAALTDHDFVAASRGITREGRLRLDSFFKGLGLRVLPSQANFVAVDTRRDAKAFFAACLEAGVSIRPMTSFGMPTWIRVTIGTSAHLDLFEAAFRQAMDRVPPQT